MSQSDNHLPPQIEIYRDNEWIYSSISGVTHKAGQFLFEPGKAYTLTNRTSQNQKNIFVIGYLPSSGQEGNGLDLQIQRFSPFPPFEAHPISTYKFPLCIEENNPLSPQAWEIKLLTQEPQWAIGTRIHPLRIEDHHTESSSPRNKLRTPKNQKSPRKTAEKKISENPDSKIQIRKATPELKRLRSLLNDWVELSKLADPQRKWSLTVDQDTDSVKDDAGNLIFKFSWGATPPIFSSPLDPENLIQLFTLIAKKTKDSLSQIDQNHLFFYRQEAEQRIMVTPRQTTAQVLAHVFNVKARPAALAKLPQ